MRLFIFAAAAVLLTGCAGSVVTKPTPEPLSVTINALAAAGCTIQYNIDVGGATGQLGGGFHANNIISGGCDPSKASTFGGAGVTLSVPAKK